MKGDRSHLDDYASSDDQRPKVIQGLSGLSRGVRDGNE
jgi:hypothetical protein